MRVTTIPFSFSLTTGLEGYSLSQPLPANVKITHLYALGEPSPSQLLYIMLFKWAGSNPPASGQPSGASIFDDVILLPKIRLGRIPVDMILDVDIVEATQLLCYANNTNSTTQQAMVQLEVVLP